MSVFRATSIVRLLAGTVLLLPAVATPALPAAAQNILERLPGGGDQPVFFIADEITYDEELSLITATGNVEITQGERILRARTVTYNQKTGVVTASGDVTLLEPTGEVLFADYAELTEDMREGFIEQVRLLLSDDSRFAANYGRRTEGRRTVMYRVVYSPCKLCEEDPTRAPLWQIKAEQVIHDEVAKDIQYKDARLEFFGIPVLYTPYFSHPDPTVERRSGFLAPTFGHDSDLGYTVQAPYHFAIAPNRDATFAPMFLSDEGLVAVGEYRHLFTDGELRVEGSLGELDRRERDAAGREVVKEDRLRGHIRARGAYDIDENWRTRFSLYRATDDTYLRKLDFDDAPTLRSEAAAEYFEGRTYGSISAFAVQELRDDVDDDETPVVLPSLNYNYVSHTGRLGDFWTLDANALALHRDEDNPESRRVSVTAGWHLPYTTEGGHLFDLGLTVRADAYSVDSAADPDSITGEREDGFAGRFFPQAMLGWRYPLVRTTETMTQLIEPIVTAIIAPTDLNPDKIPNEDSRSFEFDDTNLFDPNRFPGLDRVEGGQRLNYGLRGGLFLHSGTQAEFLIGQSLRANEESVFPEGSGLEDRISDNVGRLTVSPSEYLDLVYRFRLDKDNFELNRSEAGFQVGTSRLRLTGDYVLVDTPRTTDQLFERREQINATVSARLGDYWTVFAGHQRDLNEDEALEHRLGITYADECFVFQTTYVREFTEDREVEPGEKILFRLIFKNIGQFETTQSFGAQE